MNARWYEEARPQETPVGELLLDREEWMRANAHLTAWVRESVVPARGVDEAVAFATWYQDAHLATADAVDELPRYNEAFTEWLGAR